MKYIILVPDGVADEPVDALGGLTPLAYADTPHMDRLASQGELGLARTVPEGMSPGSDTANLSIFGYDPTRCYTGRAPLEAASMGIDLGDRIAWRCNLVTLIDGRMEDFTSGHISTEEAHALIESLNQQLGGDGYAFHPGVSYRHLMVAPPSVANAATTPPHDIIGKECEPYLPSGTDQQAVRDLMTRSQALLAEHPVNRQRAQDGKPQATSIWLWGQGTKPSLETAQARYGTSGAVVSAVDLVKGIGRLAGFEVLNVPGATGYLDTNYQGKVDYALDALARVDVVYLHIEATDETGHQGDPQLKLQAVDDFDRKVVGPVLQGVQDQDVRILLMPDHPTPLRIRTHTAAPVPYVLYDSRAPQDNSRAYTEEEARRTGVFEPHAHNLFSRLVERAQA